MDNAAGTGGASNDASADAASGGAGGSPDVLSSDAASDVGPDTVQRDGGASDVADERERPDSPTVLEYVATIAECLEEGSANPDACRAYAAGLDGPNEVWVDIRRPPRSAFTGYVRFDFDSALDGRTVLSARLELTATGYVRAAGTAPEIWEATPFNSAALFVQAPALLGTAPLSASMGSVAVNQTITYDIPASVVQSNRSVYVALVAAGPGSDGSGFWNTQGASPPRIVLSVQ